ncbi:MAG: transcriptional regulator [Calditrichaeota bacterium]|nr:MAG: transcriptional regulator [Calditrichota bacterium]
MAVPKIEICRENVVDGEKVERVHAALPEDREIAALAETFKVLGDPTRLRIVLALAMEELCVCDLAALIGVSVSAISHQLRQLRQMRLVKYRKNGKMVFYSLDDEHIEHIIAEAQTHVRE